MKYLSLVIFLTSCVSFKISITEQMARAGYSWASTCLGYSEIPFSDIGREVVKGQYFDVKITTDEGKDTVLAGLIGFADLNNKKVLVAKPYRDNARLWGHEYLHYISKVKNHPDSLFTRCNLR